MYCIPQTNVRFVLMQNNYSSKGEYASFYYDTKKETIKKNLWQNKRKQKPMITASRIYENKK